MIICGIYSTDRAPAISLKRSLMIRRTRNSMFRIMFFCFLFLAEKVSRKVCD